MRSRFFIALIFVFILTLSGCQQYHPSPADSDARIIAVSIDTHIFRVDVADSESERSRGLSGHTALADDYGMLFVFPHSERPTFWMKGMLVPIDIIWIRDGVIVGITADIPPPGDNQSKLPLYPAPNAVDHVLEVRAGLAGALGMSVGDEVRYVTSLDVSR